MSDMFGAERLLLLFVVVRSFVNAFFVFVLIVVDRYFFFDFCFSLFVCVDITNTDILMKMLSYCLSAIVAGFIFCC